MPRKTRQRASASGRRAGASMRPRPDAAENLRDDELAARVEFLRFNEAAARCRGKL